ncbi:trehalase family glycosidase [Chelatococcus sp. SYSU_G07232]|uniref:Trehalase family glycosidase n=1 Tax=Chelatococcus albus TaxID=3047466 RepID=A0ABT7AJ70_9HYPH|nr:trehalase family glycosidase [Chelatococcus sp. SYSU_G07232]MDJ1159425.1 trehalase family glycosidase [Chelatococcus sp. SYSU_G07232]
MRPVLERKPDDAEPLSSLLPLPGPYIVPGGRFREIYHWDSYFTMLGREESGRHELAPSMVENFATLITRYGHVPNGIRSCYLSRSQPPFFAAMVELVAGDHSDRAATLATCLPALAREYAFWMEGADTGQQRDAPNGWAPLQWIAVKGLRDYGEEDLARVIAQRFATRVVVAFRATGKLMEKYNVVDDKLATGGGEYPTPDGFGWTNGVLRKLLALYPDAVTPREAVAGRVGRAANDNLPAGRVGQPTAR